MSQWLFVLAIAWVICGVLTAGLVYAYLRAEPTNDSRDDLGTAVCLGLLGPAGLLITFLFTGFAKHGWKLR